MSLEEASRTAGHALPPMATISRMRNERLVRLVGPEEGPLVDTYHDRVRETILGRMEEGTSRTIHRTLAEIIEPYGGGLSVELIAALERGSSGRKMSAITNAQRASGSSDWTPSGPAWGKTDAYPR